MDLRCLAKWAGVFLAVSVPRAAFADSAYYLEGRAGVVAARGNSIPQFAAVSFAVAPNPGWSVAATAGYQFSQPFRLGIEVGHQRNPSRGTYVENIQLRIFPPCGQPIRPCFDSQVTGGLSATSLVAMGYYELDNEDRWHFSIGAGLGATRLGLKARSLSRFLDGTSRPFSLINSVQTVFTGRGTVEVAYVLGSRTSLVANYGFSLANTAKFEGAGNLAFQYRHNPLSHGLSIGVRYSL